MFVKGDEVIISPADVSEGWLLGTVEKTITAWGSGSHALHVVRVKAFKWAAGDPWGAYDGVPLIVGRETRGVDQLEFVEQWNGAAC